MTRAEEKAHHSRNFWDSVHADNLMSVIKRMSPGDLWRGDMMEAHLHLAWHFAHDENANHDFCVRHNIKSVLEIANLVTRSNCHA